MSSPDPCLEGEFVLTVRSALELEIFQRAGATVVAGQRSLDRRVRWAHSGEIADIATFLAGGELLMTAGSGIGATEEEQCAYLRSVTAAGIAALAVELAGRVFSEFPVAMVKEAEVLGLPLIALAHEIPFVEVTSQVHNRIVDLRVQELTREKLIDATFTDLLLRGEDYLSVIKELSRRACMPVVLEDAAHQMQAYSERTPWSDTVVQSWDQHSRLDHSDPAIVGCTNRPVALRGEVWGWIHILHGETTLSNATGYALGRAAATVAITLLGEQVRGARRSQRDTALVNRLMLGDIDGQGLVDRALRMGRDLRGKSFVAVVVGPGEEGRPFGEHELGALLTRAGAGAIMADTGDHTLAIVALPARRGERAVLDLLKAAPARVGISRVVTAERLVTAVHEAQKAFAATHTDPDHRLVRFQDLGVLRLLMSLADGAELANYVEDELGVLLAHDAASGNQLIPTLRIFLECDGRKTEAAQRLFVQRRTLYYRLDRISSLLNRSLELPETRHRLLIALQGLDLLQRPRPESYGAVAGRW